MMEIDMPALEAFLAEFPAIQGPIRHWQAQVDAHADATLEEHIALWADRHGVQVSPATMCRALQKIDRPREKDLGRQRTG
jgi:hypothetical protein